MAFFALQILEKQVILVQPTLSSGSHITAMTLVVGDETYKMENNTKRIWRCFVKIPYKKLEKRITFKIFAEVTSSSALSLHLLKNHHTWPSNSYVLTEAAVERVVWNTFAAQTVEQAEHFKDIVVNWSPISSLEECCMQIESFSKSLKLERRDAVAIYKTLLESLDKDSANHWLLLLIIVANIFRSAQMAADIVKEKEINNIMKVLNRFRLEGLPSSSTKYLPTILRELCKKVKGDSYCFVMFLSATYPFLSGNLLSDMLLDTVKERGKIVPSKLDKVENEILAAICAICSSAESDENYVFLEKLFLQFPIVLMVKTYAHVRGIQGSSLAVVSEKLLETVKGSLMSYTKSSQRTISNLAEVWGIIETTSDLSEIVKSDFESAVVSTICKTTGEDLETLRQVLLQTRLFNAVSQQTEVIQCLSNARQSELHVVLFAILMDPKYKEAADNFTQKWFSLCIENGVIELKRSGSTERKLRCVYTYFAIANEVPMIRNSSQLQDVLTTTAVEFLRQLDLKVLMRSTKIIEELSAKSQTVVELFRNHLKALLSDQHHNNYYEILIDLCGTHGEIRVNSR